jgi:hypothetical protein
MRTGLLHFVLQAGLVLGAPLVAFAPRRDGAHLVVPLAGGDPGRTYTRIAGANVRLLAAGPLPGSVVVWGDGLRLAWRAVRRGAVVIAAAPSGCSLEREPK